MCRLGLLWCPLIKATQEASKALNQTTWYHIEKEKKKENHCGIPQGFPFKKIKGVEKNGSQELSIHQMSLMFLPKTEDPVPSQVEK